MKRVSHILLLFILLSILILSSPRLAAQASYIDSIEMTAHALDFVFSEHLVITAQFPTDINIRQVQLVFKSVDNIVSSDVFEIELQNDNLVQFNYDFERSRNYPAYSTLQYSFIVTTQDGQQLETDIQSFIYVDNRFEWQTIDTDNRFVIHWYNGNLDFAQSILVAAQNGLAYADQLVELPQPERIHIFVYANALDVRKALNIPPNVPVAGHASPSNNLIFVSIQPGIDQTVEIERQVPHEISHIRLYLLTRANYDRLPNWLREGLASLSEIYPNPDFSGALDIAAEQGELLPFSLLCAPFPTDARYAFLAYAQSQSMVHYIFETYGSSGLRTVIQSYAAGESCENGMVAAAGKTLSQVERGWQIWQFSTPQTTVTQTTSPLSAWLILLLIPLSWPIFFIFVRKK